LKNLLAGGADHTFFMDIARDGIALYEADDNDEVARPKPKTPHAALDMAREYYEEWYPSAESFVRGYRYAFRDGDLKKAAFDLHQSAERFCHTVLLVLTSDSPLCRARHKGAYAERRTMPT